MKKVSQLALALMALPVVVSSAYAATDVNVNINGYLPAPPGVQVSVDGGRPYYRERDRVVYLEKDERRHKGKRGHAYGHRKQEGDKGRHGNGKHGKHD